MNKTDGSVRRYWPLLATVVAISVVAAGCTSARAQAVTRTYAVKLQETERSTGYGAPRERQVTLNATMQLSPGSRDSSVDDRESLVFTSESATGDPALAASGGALDGEYPLARDGNDNVLSGDSDDVGALDATEAVLLFQAIVPSGFDVKFAGSVYPREVTLTGGPTPTSLRAHDGAATDVAVRGIPAWQVTTTAETVGGLRVTAYNRKPPVYVPDAGFAAQFATPPSLPIPTETAAAAAAAADSGSSLSDIIGGLFDAFGDIIEGIGCVASLGRACPPAEPATARPGNTLVEIPGPQPLELVLSGAVTISSSQVLDRRDGTVLNATGTGRASLSGSLPVGSDIPTAVSGKAVSVVTDVTYSSRLVSPWPSRPQRSRLPVDLAAVAALVLVGTATAVTIRRRRTLPG